MIRARNSLRNRISRAVSHMAKFRGSINGSLVTCKQEKSKAMQTISFWKRQAHHAPRLESGSSKNSQAVSIQLRCTSLSIGDNSNVGSCCVIRLAWSFQATCRSTPPATMACLGPFCDTTWWSAFSGGESEPAVFCRMVVFGAFVGHSERRCTGMEVAAPLCGASSEEWRAVSRRASSSPFSLHWSLALFFFELLAAPGC
mmetsp:Transcript_33750/g.72908  ORF Transcript_33750/g.72908 Transcript_33750/m.72908 type:complete len:200 (-) Transcript_33750:354-953(-)